MSEDRAPDWASARFLLVEGNTRLRLKVRSAARRLGVAEILSACDIPAAKEILPTMDFQAAAIDLSLDGGIDLLRSFMEARTGPLARTAVVAIAPDPPDYRVGLAEKLGVDEMVRRPVVEGELLAAMARAVRSAPVSPPDKDPAALAVPPPATFRPPVASVPPATLSASPRPGAKRDYALAGDGEETPAPPAPAPKQDFVELAPPPAALPSASGFDPDDIAPAARPERGSDRVELAAPPPPPTAPLPIAPPPERDAPEVAEPEPPEPAAVEPKSAPAEKGLDEILSDHALWVTSKAQSGSRAHLDGRDLSGIDLGGGVVLSNASLAGVALVGAELSGADLAGADLRRAELLGASLDGANLAVARLRHARLAGCSLSGANLKGADLSGADLAGAVFGDAELSGAVLLQADLKGADLSAARGLTRAQLNDATLDADTLLPAGFSLPGTPAV